MKLRSFPIACIAGLMACGAAFAQTAAPEHSHGDAPSPAVRAALDEAIARLPPPDYSAIVETRRAGSGKADAGSLVTLEAAVRMSVVVVLDEHGVPHSECVESAPPDATSAPEPER